MAVTIIKKGVSAEKTMFVCSECKMSKVKDDELCSACKIIAQTQNISSSLMGGVPYTLPADDPEQPQEYTILQALDDLIKGKSGTLMFERLATGESYQVLAHDPETNLTRLLGPSGMTLRVKVGERESKLYRPYFR